MLNNADWILKFNYMDFLREVGVAFLRQPYADG